MSALELKLIDDDFPDGLYGRYSDRQALPILQQYLEVGISDYNAANQFTKLLPAASDRNAPSLGLKKFGAFLCRMAEQIPYSHPARSRLAQLVQTLRKSAKLSLQTEDDGYLIWTELDGLGLYLTDNFPLCFDDDDPELPDSYNHCLNFSAFCARLIQCGYLARGSFPIWQMQIHLETKLTDSRGIQFAISSSALWFILAGQAIYTQVVEAPNYPSPSGHKPGELYKGPETGLERWRFWKNVLADAGGDKEATGEHCALARKAAAVIETIEQSMLF